MTEETKYFAWYDSSDNRSFYGPWRYGDEQTIGKKLYHTLDELLKMNITESLKKRLRGAKIGTRIKIHYLHSSGDLMVKRIKPEGIPLLEEIEKIDNWNVEMHKKISENNATKEKFCTAIFGKSDRYT